MAIKLNIYGFDEMLDKLSSIGGNIDGAAKKVTHKIAPITKKYLDEECSKAKVPSNITSAITIRYQDGMNLHSCDIGWKKGTYDPDNLSTGYKAMMLNYGTVRRYTREGLYRGWLSRPYKMRKKPADPKPNQKIKAGFIQRAIRKANSEIKQTMQEDMFKYLD